MAFLEVAIRTGAALLSLPLIYLAWFVYEDEEKKLQSKVEKWWIQVDDLRAHMVKLHAAFVSVIARRQVEIIDKIFSKKLFSFDALATVICLCVASYYLLFGFIVSMLSSSTVPPQEHMFGALLVAGMGLFFVLFVLSPLFSRFFIKSARPGGGAAIAWCATNVISFLYKCLANDGELTTKRIIDYADAELVVPFGLFVATATTFVMLWLLRKTLLLFEVNPSRFFALSSILAMIGVIGLAVSMVCWLAIFAVDSRYEILSRGVLHFIVVFVPAMTLFSSFVFLFLAIALLMTFHLAAWPMISRLTYNLHKRKFIENKSLLNGVAISLITIALGGGDLRKIAAWIGAIAN